MKVCQGLVDDDDVRARRPHLAPKIQGILIQSPACRIVKAAA